jgi:SAM-dependent MidA family methyltransferase
MTHLPSPDPLATAHSQRLSDTLQTILAQSGGAIPFIDFMDYVLYAPGLGYYSAGSVKFGTSGDFITAPQLSPLFSQCIAQQCQQVLATLNGQGSLLEFGAGEGVMAADILQTLAHLDCLPKEYIIIEVSADLRERQQAMLQRRVPDLFSRIHWLNSLPPPPFKGVILANEVLDAMPVHRFQLEEQEINEFYVGHDGTQFIWKIMPTSHGALRAAVEALRPHLSNGYISEVNLNIVPWLKALAEILTTGLILIIDYGFPKHEYYHPQRHQGTLMCHYRHHAHDNPLILPGLQDITAHVDFTAVAQAAQSVGLQVNGYTNQANFLLATGLTDLLSESQDDMTTYLRLAQQVKLLLLPSEMGELFKVIALTRHWDGTLLGFERDEQKRLGMSI